MIRNRAVSAFLPDVPSAGSRHSARCQGHVLPRQMRNLSSGGSRTGITSMNSQGVDLLCKIGLAIHQGLTRGARHTVQIRGCGYLWKCGKPIA